MIKILDVDKTDKTYCLKFIFNNGASGICNLTTLILNNPIFSSLYEEKDFFSFSNEKTGLRWKNNIDLSVEWIYNNTIFDELPLKKIDFNFIKNTLDVSNKDIAIVFDVSLETVESWLKGEGSFSKADKKLYFIIINNPEIFSFILNNFKNSPFSKSF